MARALTSGQIELGAIHTYIELFGRYFIDLTPKGGADRWRARRTSTATSTWGLTPRISPVVIEATAFKQGIVVAQVNAIVDKLPRVDVPGDRIDYVVETPKPFYVEPLFTRDPAQITETQILTAMLAIRAIYEPYAVRRLNHGIGFNTAAIELLLPTYGEKLGLKGRICTHFRAEPAPDADPGDRERLGQANPLLRLGGRHGRLHGGTARHLLPRPRRLDGLQPHVLPGGRALRDRHVHRLDAADRPRRQFLHRHDGPHRRLRRARRTWVRTRTAGATPATLG